MSYSLEIFTVMLIHIWEKRMDKIYATEVPT